MEILKTSTVEAMKATRSSKKRSNELTVIKKMNSKINSS